MALNEKSGGGKDAITRCHTSESREFRASDQGCVTTWTKMQMMHDGKEETLMVCYQWWSQMGSARWERVSKDISKTRLRRAPDQTHHTWKVILGPAVGSPEELWELLGHMWQLVELLFGPGLFLTLGQMLEIPGSILKIPIFRPQTRTTRWETRVLIEADFKLPQWF